MDYQPVLTFWFETYQPKDWFVKSDAFDAAVRQELGPLHERARDGECDHWKASAEGCVALCVLLDQAPRNLFRGSARAFATDAQAREVSRHALDQDFDQGGSDQGGSDQGLSDIQRVILYLPFEHSESLSDQNLSVALFEQLTEDKSYLDYAIRHRDVIETFGRFPHRNAVLGRENTPAEETYLAKPGAGF